jgi:hypothetical protein
LGVALGVQIAVLTIVALVGMGYASWRIANQRISESASRRIHGATHQRAVITRNIGPALVLVMNIGFVIVLAVGRPLSIWDSWVTWGMKARTIFIEGGLSAAVYLDPSRAVTHLDYPLMIPQLEAWTYGWLGAADDRFAGWQSLAFYLALSGICCATLRRWGASTAFALWVTAAVAGLGPLALWSGLVFAEVQVAVLVMAAAVYLIDWLESGSRHALWIAALAGGLLPWAKREGWVLLFVICICVVAIIRDRRMWKAVGAMLLAALLIGGPWWLVVSVNGVANTDFLPISLSTFVSNLDRLPVIARMMMVDLLDASWNLVWMAAALLGIRVVWQRLSVKRLRLDTTEVATTAIDVLPFVAVAYLVLMGLSFVFSAYVPYQQHIATSALRLMAHIAPLTMIWIAARILRGDDPSGRIVCVVARSNAE